MANNGEAQILVGLSKNSIRSLGRVDCSEYPLVLGVDPILQRTSLLHVWGQLTLLPLLFVAGLGLLPELLVLVLSDDEVLP